MLLFATHAVDMEVYGLLSFFHSVDRNNSALSVTADRNNFAVFDTVDRNKSILF